MKEDIKILKMLQNRLYEKYYIKQWKPIVSAVRKMLQFKCQKK